MAKIGVVTFAYTLDNYGQVLQYLAIQEYLQARGHSVSLLCQGRNPGLVVNIVRKCKSVVRLAEALSRRKHGRSTFQVWNDWSVINDALHPRHFSRFRKRHFNLYYMSGGTYPEGMFDAFAVGSDQVWSSLGEWFFLRFARYDEKKFAIAPSMGKTVYGASDIRKLGDWIKDFAFVTCREESAVRACWEAGRTDASLLLDPTLLIPADVYRRYASTEPRRPGRYVLLYLLGADIPADVSSVYAFAAREHLEVVYVASQGRQDHYRKTWATLPQWLGLLDNAEYVITNSFHGMAFSIIFRKKFLVLPVVGEMEGMNVRIYNLASLFGLESRIYSGDMQAVKNDVCFADASSKILQNRRCIDSLLGGIGY